MHSIVCILVIIFVLYLAAIMPRMNNRPDYSPLMGYHYAHRGLHDNKSFAPENSIAAFQKAIHAGYGIELDVQLTKDCIPVIFHDETLDRVCGIPGNVRDYTYEELQQLSLYNSQEKIPCFSEFLKIVNGRVPLIVEIKIYEHTNANCVCTAVDELLQGYSGVYCIESFNPLAVRWYMTHHPEVIRGQLSSNFNKRGKIEHPVEFLVHYLITNCICRPDFIAYNHHHKKNISRMFCQYLYKALGVTWTIRSQRELDDCRDDFSLFIFEGFIPDKG